ncbi:sugar phosphate isomerase/epimerase family protein [Fusobacterium sp. PH5-44]|uniref:sugar phosphate isomerase/epimerase family protein n=1 Tax=unclassified Fusobacterium TaxID=2648384 RepID=UPI003D1D54B4
MLIGSRTHDFGRHSIENLPKLLKNNSIEAAQLVLPKGFTDIELYSQVNSDILDKIKKSFADSQVKIHILGCYMDLGNPDNEIRKNAVDTFKKCLSFGKYLGVGVVGTETAYPRLSPNEKKLWYPYMIDSLAQLVTEAEKVGQDMAIEPVYWHPLENLDITIKIFEQFKSRYLKMIFDPANVLEYPEINQGQYWKQWLSALGDKIEAMHMKDFVEGKNREYIPVALGKGVMDYTEIIKWSKINKPNIVVIREELEPQNSIDDIQYIKNLWK